MIRGVSRRHEFGKRTAGNGGCFPDGAEELGIGNVRRAGTGDERAMVGDERDRQRNQSLIGGDGPVALRFPFRQRWGIKDYQVEFRPAASGEPIESIGLFQVVPAPDYSRIGSVERKIAAGRSQRVRAKVEVGDAHGAGAGGV